jgi:hypothetical protein
MASDAAESPVVPPPLPSDLQGWNRLERAARAAAIALHEWRRRATEAENEVQRLRGELEQVNALGSLPSVQSGDEIRRLRAENAVLTSRATEARQRISGLLARLAVLENRP